MKAIKFSMWFLAIALLIGACRKRDADAPELDNLVNFESAAQGIGEAEPFTDIKLKLSRAVTQNVNVIVNVTATNLTYGTDYTTTPAVVDGAINVTIPSGNNEAVIKVNKIANLLYDGDEEVQLDIYSSGAPVIIGTNKSFKVTFSELIANEASIVLNGGGANYPNKVFVDISANRQTAVNRNNWDLGFYTGAENRVIINSSINMMVKQINKNDLTAVTAADTVGLISEMAFNFDPVGLPFVDYPTGNLTRTAIAEIAANPADNKVYIVNRGTSPGPNSSARGWKKIRIIRSANGYTLQHADIASTTFQEIQITKDPAYFFTYASFETGALKVEPEAKKWDIAWTYFVNTTTAGGTEVPYLYQDIILINRNVQVAKVLTATVSFESFGESNLAGLTFNTAQNSIGADWRMGGGPGMSPSVYADRFYIVKDGDNNIYKVKFTSLTDNNGVRGNPAYQVKLVKKG